MPTAIIHDSSAFSDYIEEILRAWGFNWVSQIAPGDLAKAHPEDVPAIVCPASSQAASFAPELDRYAAMGGTVILLQPSGAAAELAGLTPKHDRGGAVRLRVFGCVVQGLLGNVLPISCDCTFYDVQDGVDVLGALFTPNEFKGEDSESPGITLRNHGKGKVVALAFNLPRNVMILRQGDPALANKQFDSQSVTRRMCKPSNMATDIGPYDAGDIPYADLLGRVLVDLLLEHMPTPVPMMSAMPANTSGMVLLSGDEDNASLADNGQQMQEITASNGRMNLYVIPGLTHSAREDLDRYRTTHDIGPHPDLIAVCDEPPAVRAKEYERQIKHFEELSGVKPRSIRNHCAGWAGYLDLAIVQQRCGIRMDANYFSGHAFRERVHSPYSPFGGALPMRFVQPTGELIDVFQQHTQLNDDIWFAPDRPYSYKLTPAVAEPITAKLLDDASQRFCVPVTTNFHPGNWYFAHAQANALMRQAQQRNIALWSLDQWLSFWEVRDTWRTESLRWNGGKLKAHLRGSGSRADLCLALPLCWRNQSLAQVHCNDQVVAWNTRSRQGGDIAHIPLPVGCDNIKLSAEYR